MNYSSIIEFSLILGCQYSHIQAWNVAFLLYSFSILNSYWTSLIQKSVDSMGKVFSTILRPFLKTLSTYLFSKWPWTVQTLSQHFTFFKLDNLVEFQIPFNHSLDTRVHFFWTVLKSRKLHVRIQTSVGKLLFEDSELMKHFDSFFVCNILKSVWQTNSYFWNSDTTRKFDVFCLIF